MKKLRAALGKAVAKPKITLDADAANGLVDELIHARLRDLVDWEGVRALEETVSTYFADYIAEDGGEAEMAEADRFAAELMANAWKQRLEQERAYMEATRQSVAHGGDGFPLDDDCELCRQLARELHGPKPKPDEPPTTS